MWPVNAAGAAIGFGMYAFGFLLPQLLQADPAVAGVGFGASVTTTSLYLLPALVSGLGAGAVAGLLGRRSGSMLPFVLGMAAMASGYVLLVVAMNASAVVVLATLVSHGVGLNLALAAMANLIVDGAPSERTAEASGVNATIRTIGGALGIPLVAIVLLAPRGGDELSGRGFELAFGLSALILLVGIALQPGLGRAVRRREVDSITAN